MTTAVNRASREPARASRDPALDGLRGVAVLLVFLFHYGGGLQSNHFAIRLFGYLSAAGWIGVVLFFALSGFLITGILRNSINESRALLNFYARRILRIFPLYYVTLVIAAVMLIEMGNTLGYVRLLYVYALFLQNIPPFGQQIANLPGLPLYHLWTLAAEEQFYLLWPCLLLLCRTQSRALRLCLWTFLLSAVFRIVFFAFANHLAPDTVSVWSQSLPTHAGALALGAALAILLQDSNWQLIHRYATAAFTAGVTLYILTSLYAHDFTWAPHLQFILGLPAISLAAAASIPISLRDGLTRRILATPILRFFGRISYSFYVFHVLLQPLYSILAEHLTQHSDGPLYLAARMLVALILTTFVAFLSYEALERTFLDLKRFFPQRPALQESFLAPKIALHSDFKAQQASKP